MPVCPKCRVAYLESETHVCERRVLDRNTRFGLFLLCAFGGPALMWALVPAVEIERWRQTFSMIPLLSAVYFFAEQPFKQWLTISILLVAGAVIDDTLRHTPAFASWRTPVLLTIFGVIGLFILSIRFWKRAAPAR